jgi:hypothetical protein
MCKHHPASGFLSLQSSPSLGFILRILAQQLYISYDDFVIKTLNQEEQQQRPAGVHME